MANEKKGAVVILKTYFGFMENQTMQEFAKELKCLSDQEKHELALLAAKELGFEVEVPTRKSA